LAAALTVLLALSPVTFLPAAHAKKLSGTTMSNDEKGNDNIQSSPSSSTSSNSGTNTNQVVSTPTYNTQTTMENIIRDIMNEFSHMTSLHESLNYVPPPLFSRHSRGFGWWDHGQKDDGTAASASTSTETSPSSSSGNLAPWGTLTRWSPRYEVVDDAKNFQISLHVPGFNFHEMKVELESGGRVLSIVGSKEEHTSTAKESPSNGENEKMAGKGERADGDEEQDKSDEGESAEFTTSVSFQQKFTLDPSVDTSKMTANLVDGKLVVRAPRKYDGFWNKKRVPITQFDEDVWAELSGEFGDDNKNNSEDAAMQQ
jgi:HSP20 family molecular chaperone IbpA